MMARRRELVCVCGRRKPIHPLYLWVYIWSLDRVTRTSNLGRVGWKAHECCPISESLIYSSGRLYL